ncbi:cell division protein ZapB [bacterium]|nr:cell division protein ZapB [bacterium]
MEMLGVLEKKIESLVELLKELKSENSLIKDENLSLKEKVSQLETSLLHASERFKEENSSAKKIVDNLIAGIDSLIEVEGR